MTRASNGSSAVVGFYCTPIKDRLNMKTGKNLGLDARNTYSLWPVNNSGRQEKLTRGTPDCLPERGRAHRWDIDQNGRGICSYCKKEKQMARSFEECCIRG